jgi:hypothetical protein
MTTYDRILCEIVFDAALRDVGKKADYILDFGF